jgi:hypothetical protein
MGRRKRQDCIKGKPMTSELKCPACPYCNKSLHCGAELNVDGHNIETWCCTNHSCEQSEDLIGTREMWEIVTNMIQAKQDLEIARKALEKIESTEWYDSMSSYEIMTFTAMKALEQIEHKDKQ